MSFIPESELKKSDGISLAPMIDFLFLMLVFFASMAVSRVTTKDMEVELVKLQAETGVSITKADTDLKVINLTILPSGQYKWSTELRDYVMDSPKEITDELVLQYRRGILPQTKEHTHILLKIDRKAPWDSIADLIFSIRQSGFSEVRPVYEPVNTQIANST